MPACASPAIESPATTATAIGRNSGSTMASAATENSEPLESTADRKAGPCPAAGRGSVTASSIATRVGSAFSRPMRHPGSRTRANSLRSSTAIIGASTRSVLGPVRCKMISSRLRRSSASSVTGIPGATSAALTSAGSLPRTMTSSPVPIARPARPAPPTAAAGSGGTHNGASGGRPQRRQLILHDEPAAVEHPDPGAQRFDLG